MSCLVAEPTVVSTLLSYLHSDGMEQSSCQRLGQGIHISNLEAYAHRYRITCTLTAAEGRHDKPYQLNLKPTKPEVLKAVEFLSYQISDHALSNSLPVIAYLDKLAEEIKAELANDRSLPPGAIPLLGMIDR